MKLETQATLSYVLTLTEEEVIILHELAGRIGGSPSYRGRAVADEIYNALSHEGINSQNSHKFEGYITAAR